MSRPTPIANLEHPPQVDVITEDTLEQMATQVRSIAHAQMAESDIQEREQIRELFRAAAQKILSEHKLNHGLDLSADQHISTLRNIFDYAYGHRVTNYIQRLEGISDVFLNGTKNTILVHRNGRREIAAPLFTDLVTMNTWLTNLRMTLGMYDSAFDPHHPSFNTRLPSGIRVNATHTSNTSYSVSFRIPNRDLRTLRDLHANETIDTQMEAFLTAAVNAKLNIVIAGGTGAGKTALLLCMLGHLPKLERVVTIEDSLELDLEVVHPHLDVTEFEYLAPNTDGLGEVTTRERLANSLRMHPDRIIVGEVRDEIANELLQAMATGNDGALSTIHARSPRSIIDRLIDCSGQAPQRIHEAVRNSIDLFIHITTTETGQRRITDISQVTEQRGPNDCVVLQPIFTGGGAITADGATHPTLTSSPTGEVAKKLSNARWKQ